jgi:hypothetical protein
MLKISGVTVWHMLYLQQQCKIAAGLLVSCFPLSLNAPRVAATDAAFMQQPALPVHCQNPSCWHLARKTVLDVCWCLIVCRTSRGLHFWEVVPLEVLLEQLVGTGAAAPGSRSVAQKLHQLLVPSYFPNPREGAVSAAAGLLSRQ